MDIRISGRGDIPSGEYDKISISGSGSLLGNIEAQTFKSSGTVKGESFECKETLKVSGRALFSGKVKSGEILVAGSFKTDDSIEANSVKISGRIKCKGTLKAKDIKICVELPSYIGEVNGESVQIKRKRLSLMNRKMTISSQISGESVTLGYVVSPLVIGKKVVIGRGCKIGVVKYSDEIQISKGAKIGKVEKI